MQRFSPAGVYVAVVIMAAGFLLIVLGWNGAADIDFAQGQLPFIISGGLAGIALLGVGLGLAVAQVLRRNAQELAGKIEEMIEVVAMDGLPGGVPTAEEVVAGRTSFHRPACHLVESRRDLERLPADAAQDRGLSPCKICNPPTREPRSEIVSTR